MAGTQSSNGVGTVDAEQLGFLRNNGAPNRETTGFRRQAKNRKYPHLPSLSEGIFGISHAST